MVNENEFLLHSLLLGGFVSLVYDGFRILRRVIPHKDFVVSLEDMGFWLYCGGRVFLLMHRESDGTLRWFAVLGALTGMLLYRKLISPWLVKYSALVLGKLLGLLGRFLRFVFRPAICAAGAVGKGARRAGGNARRMSRRIRRGVKNRLTYFFKMLKMTVKTK